MAYFTDKKTLNNIFTINAEYVVRFDANTGTGTMADQVMSYNVSTALNMNSFTKTGYEFTGWNTSANGTGTAYTDGQSVINLTGTTLYAQWSSKPIKYAVQIYGINQDEDMDGNELGLSFGPASGADYNNAYVTHSYEETSSGSNIYYVKIVTHTVATNGTETTSEQYLTKANGDYVTRTAEEMAKYNVNIHNMTWLQIASVVDKTAFLDCMLCGDTKSVELTINDVVGMANPYVQNGDGAGTISTSINSYYEKWNPSSSENSAATNGGVSGSSARDAGGYSSSHIRATLIGNNNLTNETYSGNVNLTETTSIYSCLDSDLKSVITAKKVKYLTGTAQNNYVINENISDKIWLLSEKEMYGTGQVAGLAEGLGTDGLGYSKFGNNESRYYMQSYSNSNSNSRILYQESGLAKTSWLRSPDCELSDTGALSSSNANSEYGIAFGFCIDVAPGVYRIKYNLDGGILSNGQNPTTYTSETSTFTLNNPSKVGCFFVGWSGTGLTGNDNQIVTIPQGSSGNRVYTAVWQAGVELPSTGAVGFVPRVIVNNTSAVGEDDGSLMIQWLYNVAPVEDLGISLYLLAYDDYNSNQLVMNSEFSNLNIDILSDDERKNDKDIESYKRWRM